MTVQERIGKRIRGFRKQAGYTLDSFAERVDLASGKYLGKIERGEVNATLDTLEKIARGLECRVDDFFDLDADALVSEVAHLLRDQSQDVKKQALKVVRALVE